ncbi:nodU [Symbiodinium pilosum]|uniref:NodU protein n=1 Tax=Symbiodinium pilosum TaxID=2952 RepID=A0A812WX36_SYMPI|nr:nodU [Symbiodinium pilosum]
MIPAWPSVLMDRFSAFWSWRGSSKNDTTGHACRTLTMCGQWLSASCATGASARRLLDSNVLTTALWSFSHQMNQPTEQSMLYCLALSRVFSMYASGDSLITTKLMRECFHDSRFNSALMVSFDGSGNDGTLAMDFRRDTKKHGSVEHESHVDAAFAGPVDLNSVGFTLLLGTRVKLEKYAWRMNQQVMITQSKLGLDSLSWAGKMMAYAALGSPSEEVRQLVRWYYRNSSEDADHVPAQLIRLACDSLEGQRALAAVAQAEFEEYVLDLIRAILQKVSELGLPDPDGLVLSGGCALNVLANQRVFDEIVEMRPSSKPMGLHITAAPNDSGLSVGGSWAIVPPSSWQPLQYVGFHLWDFPFLPDHAEKWGAKDLESLGGVEYLAELLSGGPAWIAQRGHNAAKPIIGVVRDRQEFGPRALGHRSLLAVPDSVEMRERMNRLKFRQWFRPVAPMIAEEALEEVFGRSVKSPYMTMAPKVRPEVLAKFPALSHLDGTARHQSVSREDEPWVHALLLAVGRWTGLAALINTSFNSRGKPIVNRAEDTCDGTRTSSSCLCIVALLP